MREVTSFSHQTMKFKICSGEFNKKQKSAASSKNILLCYRRALGEKNMLEIRPVHTGAGAAVKYGFRDINGRQPPSLRDSMGSRTGFKA
jgi:chorismate synthase